MSLLTAAQQKALTAAFASVPQHSSSIRLNTASPTQNSDYPKPQVQEAVSDILDPLLGRLGVHVDIAYPSMNISDIIGLSFNGNDTFTSVNGSPFGKVTFAVPVADVGLAVGKTIQVIYAVVRPDGVILSDILTLVVQPIAQNKLPTPQITEASAGTLDLNAFAGDAHVTVEPWPLIAQGQTVWLTATGPGDTPKVELLKGHPVTSGEVSGGIEAAITRAQLTMFKNGDTLTVTCKVEFAGSLTEPSAAVFPMQVYTIKTFDDSIAPSITSVKDSGGAEIPDNGTTYDTTVNVSGKASPGQKVEVLDSNASLGDALVGIDGAWSMTLSGLTAATHSIKAKALYGSGQMSNVRTLTVAQKLILDPTPVTLDGLAYSVMGSPALPAAPTAGSYIDRPASGGKPPYTYSSSNQDTAIAASDGRVWARRNGTAVITVSDTQGQSQSYSVTVTNAWVIQNIGKFIHRGALEYQVPGGHLPNMSELSVLCTYWVGNWPLQATYFWSSDLNPGGVSDAWARAIPSNTQQAFLTAVAVETLSIYR